MNFNDLLLQRQGVLIKMKEESAKAGLNLNIKTTKITTIEYTAWTWTMKKMKLLKDFAYFSPVINSDEDWSQEIKRKLRLSRAAM